MNDLPENIKDKYDIEMLPAKIIFKGKGVEPQFIILKSHALSISL